MDTYLYHIPTNYTHQQQTAIQQLLTTAQANGYTHVGAIKAVHECTAQLYQLNDDSLISAAGVAYHTPMGRLVLSINPYRSSRTELPKCAIPLEAIQ